MKVIIIFILSINIISCTHNTTNCNPNNIEVLDETTTIGDSYFSYDIQINNFDETCVNKESIRKIINNLLKLKDIKCPISSVRCFKNNGGGLVNELDSPSGDNELMFLIIRNIDTSGNFSNYDIINNE